MLRDKNHQEKKASVGQSACQASEQKDQQGEQKGKIVETSEPLATVEHGQGKGIASATGVSGQNTGQNLSSPSPTDLEVEAQIEKLRSEAGQMSALDRGELLKVLHKQGLSLHELGRRWGRNPKLVRDLVQLANLPEDMKQQIREGKLGRKKALKMAEALKNAASKPQPPLTPAEFQAQAKALDSLIVDWLLKAELTPDDQVSFFAQVWQGLTVTGCLQELFKQEAPEPHAIRSVKDPWGVIKRTEPVGPPPRWTWEVINHLILWFARWAPRAMPDRRALIEAVYSAQGRIWYIR